MVSLSQLGNSLRMTSSQIETFSRRNPKNMPTEAIQEMTSTAKDIGDKLAKVRSGPKSAALDAKMLESMVANINKIRNKSPEKPQKEISQMLEALEYLKGKLELYKSRSQAAGAKLAKRVTAQPQIKIEVSVIKEAKQLQSDLAKHLSIASKGLADLKQAFHQEVAVSDGEYRDLEKILTKTDGAVVKQIAMQSAVPLISLPAKTQNIIGKILEDIKYLHYTIGAQVRAGTVRVQASSFRLTLRKIKDRLRVLQKLNKSRGEMAAQVEQDTQK